MLLSIIYSLGISQAILLAYFLYCSRLTLWQGNLYLSQFLSCIACILSLFLARIHLGNAIPAVIFWPIVALPALFGPLLYFYIQSLNSRTTAIVKKGGREHFLPFIALIILFAPQIITSPFDGITHIDDASVRAKIVIASYVKSVLVISYLGVSLRTIFREDFKQAVSKNSLNILKLLLMSFLLVSIIGTILSTLFWTGLYISLWADFIELVFLTIIAYILSIYVLYTHLSPLHPKVRYKKTNLNISTRKQLAQRLRSLMETDNIFTQENYSAKYLSQILGVTEQNLSETLALEFDSNFYEYSNKHRVDHFKKLLKNKPNNSLIDLAYESGFTSKSSFNRSVKSVTGLTPSQLKAKPIS